MHSMKFSEYRMGIKFDKAPLAVEQNNYSSKIANVYIVYDLNVWARNSTDNFKFKNCLHEATSVAKNSDKEKYLYSGCGITFDSAGSWSFANEIARNVTIFGFDNSYSSPAGNCKNNFLVLGEGPLLQLMKDLVHQRKYLVLILVKQTQCFVSFYYNFHNNG